MRTPARLTLAIIAAIPALAQAQRGERPERTRASTPQEWLADCRQGFGWGSSEERACDVKETTIPAKSTIQIDGGPNGGISVIGWNRNEVKIVAKISAQARTQDEADSILREIRILTDGSIRADGPRMNRRGGWAVSFEVYMPRKTNVMASTMNGGVHAEALNGLLTLSTTNGGVTLDDLGGDVRARTVNGGVNVRLTGDHWEGQRLEVEATNGGVRLQVPESYNARLQAETSNGGLQTDFPVTVEGRIDRRVNTTLGSGGALISARTVNGGVRILRQ